MNRYFHLRLLWLIIFSILNAAQPDSTLLTLDRIFSGEFRGESLPAIQWLEGENAYTSLKLNAEGNFDLVRTDILSGQEQVLVPAERFIPPGDSVPLQIENYSFSSNKGFLLIFTNSRRVWRYNTKGDYYILNLKTGLLRQLGKTLPPASLMFAKISPDEQYAAYVSGNNLYLEKLEDETIIPLTHDSDPAFLNGITDWVYEEEFGLRDGFSWSPDSKHILFFHFDTRGVPVFHMINNTDSLYPKIISFPYPKAGTTNSAVTLGVVSISDQKITWIPVPDDPRNNYIPRADWAASSDEVLIQRMNRLQNENRLLLYSLKTGNVKTLFIDTNSAWVDYNEEIIWVNDGKAFLYTSDRDGWRQVYLIDKKGKIKKITRENWDVISILGINRKNNLLYIQASPENASQSYLYSVSLSGKGSIKRLTPSNQPGFNTYRIHHEGNFAFHTYTRFEQPPVISLISLPDHKLIRTLVDNQRLRQKLASLKKSPVEFFTVPIGDGVVLDGWMMKPPSFDPSRKYPVLFYVYGEPAGQTVLDAFRYSQYLWHLYLTQQGYIVISVDNRSTPAPKGNTWRKAGYRKLGCLTTADQAAAASKIMQWPFVDSTRIGVWGWSGGGTMTLNCMFRYPHIYKVGIAVAAVSDLRYYDTIYEERYMGLPGGVDDPYQTCSAVNHADGLQGKLLIIHGTGDDNVHYQNAEAVINKLIEAKKRFWMMSYPNRSHGIYEGKNTRYHLYMTMTQFLLENL